MKCDIMDCSDYWSMFRISSRETLNFLNPSRLSLISSHFLMTTRIQYHSFCDMLHWFLGVLFLLNLMSLPTAVFFTPWFISAARHCLFCSWSKNVTSRLSQSLPQYAVSGRSFSAATTSCSSTMWSVWLAPHSSSRQLLLFIPAAFSSSFTVKR